MNVSSMGVVMQSWRRFYIILMVLLVISVLSVANGSTNANQQIPQTDTRQRFVILSIDGGGIRGIIPARILQAFEERTGEPIYKLFDVISGNSTGGIIALGLVTPDISTKNVKYKASDLVSLYQNQGKDIFQRSIWQRVKTGFGIWGAKYNRTNLDQILANKFGNVTLLEVLNQVLIFSYALNAKQGHIWDSNIAKNDHKKNFYIKDIASATSAAPTYFNPVKISNITNNYCYKNKRTDQVIPVCVEADGGIWANNPAIITVSKILKDNPHLTADDIVLISIGTGFVEEEAFNKKFNRRNGALNWLFDMDIIDLILNASADSSEWITNAIGVKTYRLQLNLLAQEGKMDNASEDNIKMLLDKTNHYINENSRQIDDICRLLLENMK